MSGWSLDKLLANLHDDIEKRLAIARESFAHAPTKGDASEAIWLDLLNTYLPERYRIASAHVVDSKGVFSDQIDVVIFDRQYTPLIFTFEGQTIIPAEGVYAVFEAKQTISADLVAYAAKKVASVRALSRTSLPIPYVEGKYAAKPLTRIIGGMLCFESEWKPPLGVALEKALSALDQNNRLDIGCVAAHGMFSVTDAGVSLLPQKKPATAFLLELIATLQELGTVPMIDIRAYAKWLEK